MQEISTYNATRDGDSARNNLLEVGDLAANTNNFKKLTAGRVPANKPCNTGLIGATMADAAHARQRFAVLAVPPSGLPVVVSCWPDAGPAFFARSLLEPCWSPRALEPAGRKSGGRSHVPPLPLFLLFPSNFPVPVEMAACCSVLCIYQ